MLSIIVENRILKVFVAHQVQLSKCHQFEYDVVEPGKKNRKKKNKKNKKLKKLVVKSEESTEEVNEEDSLNVKT